MAQTNYTPILLYASGTATNVPLAANLTSSASGAELALNYADGKLFYKDSSGVVQVLATKGAGTIGGSNTQVQYNNAGALAGSANFTFNGTTVTMSNDASISGLTVGRGAGAVSTNTAVGASALGANTSGASNTAIGNNAGLSNTTGSNNAFYGAIAGYSNTTGSGNTGIGKDSLGYTTTGGANTGVGNGALYNNTTASNNTAVGYQAGYTNSTGSRLAVFGAFAGYSNTTGANNTSVGVYSLYTNSTGGYNTATGQQALYSNTTGSYNTAIGEEALVLNTTASNNTAVGYQAGYSNTTGTGRNTLVGNAAGYGITSGDQNICIGFWAGAYNTYLTTGTDNVYIGNYAAASSASAVGEIVIGGYTSTGKGSNTGFMIAASGMYQSNNSSTWSTTSDQRLKKNIVDNTVGLSAINAIQVRNFEYRLPEEVTDLPQNQAINISGVQLGAIAQELAQVLPDCVKTESTGVMSVDTTNLTWHMVNAIKELKAEVDSLKSQLNQGA